MLGWAAVFAVLAFLAGALGYFAVAGFAADLAWLFCIIALALIGVSFVERAVKGQSVD